MPVQDVIAAVNGRDHIPLKRPERIPEEGEHGLTQRLVWNLPSLPTLGSTGLVDFPQSSMPKILKGINSQILLLSQAIACVAELHERELLQATADLRAENASLREQSPGLGDVDFTERLPLKAHFQVQGDSRQNSKESRYEVSGTPSPRKFLNKPVRPSNIEQSRDSDSIFTSETPAEPLIADPSAEQELATHAQNLWPLWSKTRSAKSVLLNSGAGDGGMRVALDELARSRHVAATLSRSDSLRYGKKQTQGVLHPHSGWRISWDMIGGVLILYDIITVPLSAFDIPPMETFFNVMLWVTVFYWTLDMARNCVVGYEDKGIIHMNLRDIVVRYLTSWFIPDAIVISVDWISIIVLAKNRSTTLRLARLSKSLKAMRILRMIRLVRVVKIPGTLAHVSDTIQSAYGMAAARCLILIFAYCALIHAIGCYFYFVTDRHLFSFAGSTSWVEANNFQGKGFGFLYLVSVHWAVAQTGFTTTAILPVNNLEKTYCVVSGIFLFQVACVMVVQHLEWYNMISNMYRAQWKQEQDVRLYLREHGAAIALTNAILRFIRLNFNYRLRHKRESDIPIMRELPVRMRIKMHYQVYMPVLKKHEAFVIFFEQYVVEMMTVCHVCMHEGHHDPGCSVFHADDDAREFIYCHRGDFLYYHREGGRPRTPPLGDFVCEPALWTQWVHRGSMLAATSVEVVTMNILRFQAVMADAVGGRSNLHFLRTYANNFVEQMDAHNVDHDLWPNTFERETLVTEAQAQTDTYHQRRRTTLSNAAMNTGLAKWMFGSDRSVGFQSEVQAHEMRAL